MSTNKAPGGGAPLIKVKASCEGDMRRFSCPATYEELSAHACQKFRLEPEDNIQFQYKDADDDIITVGSTDELQEAISASSFASQDAQLRLTIIVPPVSAKSQNAKATEDGGPNDHLEKLLMAAIEALELDPEATLEYVASLKPEEVKAVLKKSPLAFVGAFLPMHKKAESAFNAAESAFNAAAASANASTASPSAELASKAVAFASTAAAALASQMPRRPEGAMHGNRHARNGPSSSHRMRHGHCSVQDANEHNLLPQKLVHDAEAEVTITDTDGDTMVFKLSEDQSRVEEWLNGALEIDDVRDMQMDLETGAVRDSKGRFTVKPEDRDHKMLALKSLLARVGVEITPIPMHAPPVQTVHIDVDLNASDDEQKKVREEAGNRVRQACGTLGADPEAALHKLAAVFAALPISTTAEGEGASAALSSGLEASLHVSDADEVPAAPEPFVYASVRDGKYADTAGVGSADTGVESCMDEDEVEAPNGKWSEQLKQVREMGLADIVSEWELVEILEKHRGSLDRVVDVLIQRQVRKTDALV